MCRAECEAEKINGKGVFLGEECATTKLPWYRHITLIIRLYRMGGKGSYGFADIKYSVLEKTIRPSYVLFR